MSNEEFTKTLKGMSFKELLSVYLEANVGKQVDFKSEFNNGDIELIEDVDTLVWFYINVTNK
jgi:hypothetical protein